MRWGTRVTLASTTRPSLILLRGTRLHTYLVCFFLRWNSRYWSRFSRQTIEQVIIVIIIKKFGWLGRSCLGFLRKWKKITQTPSYTSLKNKSPFKDLKAMKSSFLTLASSFDFSVLDFVLGGLVKMVKKILTYLKEIISLSYNLG